MHSIRDGFAWAKLCSDIQRTMLASSFAYRCEEKFFGQNLDLQGDLHLHGREYCFDLRGVQSLS